MPFERPELVEHLSQVASKAPDRGKGEDLPLLLEEEAVEVAVAAVEVAPS